MYESVKVKLMDLEFTAAAERQEEQSKAESVMVRGRDFRMAPLTIKKFDGKEENWLRFRDLFTSMVHERDMDESVKLARLQECVDEKYVPMIAGVYTGGYAVVWEQLCKRYNRKDRLVKAHVERLISLPDNPRETMTILREVVDHFRSFIRAMIVLEIDVETWDAFLFPIFYKKISIKSVDFVQRQIVGNEIPQLSELMEMVENYAVTVSGDDRIVPRPVRSKFAKAMPPGQQQPPCPACGQGHAVRTCKEFLARSKPDRLELLRQNRRCFKCFAADHVVPQCKSGQCPICGGKHNSLLCTNDVAGTSGAGPSGAQPAAIQPQVLPRP